MKQNSAVLMKILLIAGGLLLAGGVYAVVFKSLVSIRPESPKQSLEASLTVFMPEKPKDTRLIGEGFDPKSHCFDKCGYSYRLFSYSDQTAICRDLFAVLMAQGGNFAITSPSTQQSPTVSWCEERIKQAPSFTLNLEAPVRLKTGVQERSRTIVSTVISPGQRTVEYRVSEINEGVTVIR